jgi:methionyl-tRNA formyltransferase
MGADAGRLRVAFLGHARYSLALLESLLRATEAEVVAVITCERAANADGCSLAPMAAAAGVPCLCVDDLPQQAWVEWLRPLRPDVAYAFGWSTMLGRPMLEVPRLGIVGFHPTRLPRNRGRHPIIWAIALGLEETASTFFMMDAAVDAGDIVSQRRVPIGPGDDAGALYERLTQMALAQMGEFTRDLARGEIRRLPQAHADASWWRRRGYDDGRIDWRMSAATIGRLVRALAPPYGGAHCRHDGRDVKIWKTRLRDIGREGHDVEPGRVLASDGEGFTVKCGEAALEVLQHEFDAPPAPGTCLQS